MSLSNKILIIFFGIILAYTLMAFVEIRVKGDIRVLNDENSITETIPSAGIKFIILSEEFDERITISSSNTPQVMIKSKSGELIANLNYEMKNDTLVLLSFEKPEERYQITIDIPTSGFNGINSSAASVRITGINQQSLSIIQSGGRVQIDNHVTLDKLSIKASEKSFIEVYDASIDTLSLDLNHSDIRLNSVVGKIQGTISNESDLYSSGANDVQLMRDASSRMRIF